MEIEDQLAWSILARTPGLTVSSLTPLLESFGNAAAVLGRLARRGSPAGKPERAWLETPTHHLLPFIDPRYPALLRSLPDPPIALYVAGNVGALKEPQLAIVGSRCPSAQGRETAFAFAEDLGARGLCITSGLAGGIDACAHRGALAAQAVTLGVLGSGIDVVYPRDNVDLHREVERWGALVSEFAPGTPPRAGNFPRRNRIIAGLSLGTLVVEAASRSGSLITARLANDYGREVFAVPGSIQNPLCRGCHELIKTGAKLTQTIDDILCELNFSAFFTKDLQASNGPVLRPSPLATMDKDQKILLDALGFESVDVDRLVVRTGFKAEVVSSMMLILELEGHVQAAPGGRYSRVAYRRAGGER